jgi:hypothetical protein
VCESPGQRLPGRGQHVLSEWDPAPGTGEEGRGPSRVRPGADRSRPEEAEEHELKPAPG